MKTLDLETVRLFLHVLAATVWVGGQITLAALVPALRGTAEGVTKVAARAFNRIAWPAFAVLVVTGIWNVIALDDDRQVFHRTLMLKYVLVLASGVTAYVHQKRHHAPDDGDVRRPDRTHRPRRAVRRRLARRVGPPWPPRSTARAGSSPSRTTSTGSCARAAWSSRTTGSSTSGRRTTGRSTGPSTVPDRIITPGFINTHSHLDESPIDKSVQEDVGNRQFWLTGLIEILPAEMAGLDDEGARACIDYSLIELARTGTTTVVQMGGHEDYAADAIEASGLRGYVAPMYRSGRWFTPDGRRVDYDWAPDDGRAAFERAVDFAERLRGRADGRIGGLLAPAQVDTCSEALLRDSRAAADDLDLPISLHASQGVWEFQEMTRRHGRSPVEWLSDLGFLGPRTLLGHAVFVTGSWWVNFAGDDLALLASSGTSVSYNAWCFIRRGLVMESFPGYVDAGINMCLGTDTAPQSMIESLRWTAIAGRSRLAVRTCRPRGRSSMRRR